MSFFTPKRKVTTSAQTKFIIAFYSFSGFVATQTLSEDAAACLKNKNIVCVPI